jgi:transmembrane sensor
MKEDILWRYFEGRHSEKEAETIIKWLDENDENRKSYILQKNAFIELNTFADKSLLVDAAHEKFLNRLTENDQKNQLEKKSGIIRFQKLLLRYAAIFLIIVTSSTITLLFSGRLKVTSRNSAYEIQVPYGSRSKVTLPDGSKIWLNAGSSLKYNRNFGISSRDVYLEGEAYFDVAKQKNRFIVHTSHIDLQVFGTAFNVKSYPDEQEIIATLVEGSVQISSRGLRTPVILKPKEKLTYYKPDNQVAVQSESGKIKTEEIQESIAMNKSLKISQVSEIKIKEDVNTEEATSWKDGKLIINNEPLEELVKKLERKYDITFIFNSEHLKQYTYSGTLRDFPLEQVLKAMELTSPIRYTIREKTVILSDNRNFKPSDNN